ncbi:MAG: PAS domain-containing protein, partial [Cyclobacteriaceae bacterium]
MMTDILLINSTLSDTLGMFFYLFVLILFYYQVRQIRTSGVFIFYFLFGFTAFLTLIYLYGLIDGNPAYRPLEWVLNTTSVLLLIITVVLMIHNFSGQIDLSLLRHVKANYREKDLVFYSTVLSKKIYKAVFQNSNMGVAIINRKGIPIITNKYFQQLLNYSDSELTRMSFEEFTHPEDIKKDQILFRQLIDSEIEFYETDKRYIKKDGSTCWVNLQVSIATDNEILAIVKDLTDQKALNKELVLKERAVAKYSEELRITNEILMTSQEKARMGHWAVDLQTGKTTLSPIIYDIYGLPEGKEVPILEGISYYRQDFREQMIDAFEKLVSEQQEYDMELVLVSKQGTECWVRTFGYPVIENGEVVAARGLFVDIHESKITQLEKEKRTQELLAANRKIGLAQSVMGFGIWSYHTDTGEITFDDGMFELLRMTVNHANVSEWINHIRQDDKIRFYRNFIKIKQQGGKFAQSLKVLLEDDMICHITTKAESFTDEKGKVNLILGTCTDVTKDYQQLESLKVMEKTINEAQSIANFGYFSYEIDSDQLSWSAHMDNIFAQDEGFAFNLTGFINIIHPEDREMALGQITHSMQTGDPIDLKHRIVTANNDIKTVYHQAKVYLDKHDKPFKIIGITQDVTIEMELQQQLQKNLYHQQLLTRIAILLNNPID